MSVYYEFYFFHYFDIFIKVTGAPFEFTCVHSFSSVRKRKSLLLDQLDGGPLATATTPAGPVSTTIARVPFGIRVVQ